MKAICTAIIILVVLNPDVFSQNREKALNEIDRILEEFVKENLVPALTVAVSRGPEIIYSKAFGHSDLENNVKATPKTLIRIGSISKPITAVAALKLVENNKIRLDDPVHKYCKEFPEKKWPITIRHLLGHLSGIRHYLPGEIESAKPYRTLIDAFSIFGREALCFEPGTQFLYTTYGYTVLGAVLEKASEKRFFDIINETVLIPSEMTNTLVDAQTPIINNRARPYSKKGTQIENAKYIDSSYKIPGGGIISTAEDMVQFQMALYENRLLEDKTTELCWTSLNTSDGRATDYGLGFSLGLINGEKVVWHTGGQQGCSSAIIMLPKQKIAVAVLANIDTVPISEISKKVMFAILNEGSNANYPSTNPQ